MIKTLIATVIAGTTLWLSAQSTAEAQDERTCYPIATLKVSFRVVFPKAKQITMEGAQAKHYLQHYNSYGRPTDFKGDVILLNVMPDGTTLFVPLDAGVGCKRVVVGPKLHRMIMTKLARGAV